jgi:hypothetical protein
MIINSKQAYTYFDEVTVHAAQGPDSERHSISDRTVNTGGLLIAMVISWV